MFGQEIETESFHQEIFVPPALLMEISIVKSSQSDGKLTNHSMSENVLHIFVHLASVLYCRTGKKPLCLVVCLFVWYSDKN